VSARAPRPSGFTLLELLVAMAMFSILGIAVVALLGQGLTMFSAGTADTSMQDRQQALLPSVKDDLRALQPASSPEVLPPPPPDTPAATTAGAPPPATGPAIRLRSGWMKLADVPTDWPPVFYAAFARTNARESEDPILRTAGTTPPQPGSPVRVYDPAAVDAGSVSNVAAPGGLLEVVWVAVPEDPRPERRVGPVAADSSWSRNVLTLYRLFRAPVGGDKSLLVLENINSLAKIRAAGRVMHEGVIHFGVTWRNNFAKSWTDGAGTGRAQDGQAYVGSIWDSTRALDREFALYRSADSLGNVRDDVFPTWAHVEIGLASEGAFGFGRGETTLAGVASTTEKRIRLESVEPLFVSRGGPLFFKVGTEWMSTTIDNIDAAERVVTVARAQRGTAAAEHSPGEPVYVGSSVGTDVPLVYKDRYTAGRR
jgi:prepilin-type N-terminal cleavage/methylation domain-containing protein